MLPTTASMRTILKPRDQRLLTSIESWQKQFGAKATKTITPAMRTGRLSYTKYAVRMIQKELLVAPEY